MRTGAALGPAALVGLLAVAGCGGKTSHDREIPSVPPLSRLTTTTGVAATTRPIATLPPLANANPDDEAKARTLLAQQGDLPDPDTWTAKPHERTADDQASSAQLAACVGRPDPLTVETADVDSPDFKRDGSGTGQDTITVESNADFVKTPADAQADLTAFGGPTLETCIKTIFTRGIQDNLLGQNVNLGALTFERLPVTTTYGQGTIKFRLTATLLGARGQVTLYEDLVLMVKNRAEASLTFESTGQPPPAALEETVTTAVGTRVDQS